MNRPVIILIFLLITTFKVFAGEIPLSATPQMQSTAAEQTAASQPENYNFFLGLNVSPGGSFNVNNITLEGKRAMRITGQISCRGAYYFSSFSGIMFDVGMHIFRVKETQDSYFKSYDLMYAFIAVTPILKYKSFRFYAGPYFGFLFYGRYADNAESIKENSYYTLPDIGLSLGGGWVIHSTDKMELYLGLNMKYQLVNFRRNSAAGSRILTFFVDVSLLFGVVKR